MEGVMPAAAWTHATIDRDLDTIITEYRRRPPPLHAVLLPPGSDPLTFPRRALVQAILVEGEHTGDPVEALRIGLSHLVEDVDYYDKLPEHQDARRGAVRMEVRREAGPLAPAQSKPAEDPYVGPLTRGAIDALERKAAQPRAPRGTAAPVPAAPPEGKKRRVDRVTSWAKRKARAAVFPLGRDFGQTQWGVAGTALGTAVGGPVGAGIGARAGKAFATLAEKHLYDEALRATDEHLGARTGDVLYHGTTAMLLPMLLEHGLVPSAETGSASRHRTQTRTAVFLASDPEAALMYASDPVAILEIDAVGLDVDPDYDDIAFDLAILLPDLRTRVMDATGVAWDPEIGAEVPEALVRAVSRAVSDMGDEASDSEGSAVRLSVETSDDGTPVLYVDPVVLLPVDESYLRDPEVDENYHDDDMLVWQEGSPLYPAYQYLHRGTVPPARIRAVWVRSRPEVKGSTVEATWTDRGNMTTDGWSRLSMHRIDVDAARARAGRSVRV
jgi:hypothetical protein